ncbi:MAG: ribosome maturation factor RimM [Xanthomonadales bacterium]|nr:ribosome maturation factor RimM [Xanthomonadales bacterium]
MTTGRRVLVGRIVGLYGVQGWLKIESWTEPRLGIFAYQPWLLGAAPDEVISIAGATGRAQGKGVVAQLPGIGLREQAAALVGRDIYVARSTLPPVAADEYYWTDLEGLAVFTLEGRALGRVSHLFATGANDVLVVRDGDRERLIPFAQGPVVKSVDLATQRMLVDWDPDF